MAAAHPVALGVTLVFLLVSTASALSQNLDTADEGCSMDKLNECLDRLDARQEPIGKDAVPYMSDEELDSLCSTWESTQPCMQDVKSSCDTASNNTAPLVVTEVQQRIREVNTGHEYLCESGGRQEYRSKVQTCAEEREGNLTDVSTTCQEVHHNASWYLSKSNPDNIYAFCKAAKMYLTCMEEQVMTMCGEKAAKWAYFFHRTMWMPHLDTISCDPTTGMETGQLITITFCAGATVYALIFAVVSIVRDPKRRAQCPGKCMKQKKSDGKGSYAMQNMDAAQDL